MIEDDECRNCSFYEKKLEEAEKEIKDLRLKCQWLSDELSEKCFKLNVLNNASLLPKIHFINVSEKINGKK